MTVGPDLALPQGWTTVSLADVAEITSGVGFPPDLQGRRSGDYPFAKVGDISRVARAGGDSIDAADNYVDRGDLLRLRARPIPRSSLVFAKIGESIRLNFRVLTDREMLVDNNVMAIVPNCSVIAPAFLRHCLKAFDFYPLAVATSVPSLRKTDLAQIKIPLPPLAEQQRILAGLATLQAKSRRAKEALDAIPPLLERFRQSVLAAAFRGDLTADWRAKNPNVEPASELLKRIRIERRRRWEEAEFAKMRAKGKVLTDERWKAKYIDPDLVDAKDLPDLPDGWCWANLESLTDAQRGIPYGIVLTGDPVLGGVPTVRCGDIKGFSIDLEALKRVKREVAQEFARTRLEGGEVLIAIRGTVGGTAVASPEMVGMNISREVAMIPGLAGLSPSYLMYCLAGPEAEARILKQVKGVAQAGINLADLRSLPIPLSPMAEQTRVVEQVERLLSRSLSFNHVLDATRINLKQLEGSLLATAFRGELVPQDPNDEPAAALLERVRGDGYAAGQANGHPDFNKSRPTKRLTKAGRGRFPAED